MKRGWEGGEGWGWWQWKKCALLFFSFLLCFACNAFLVLLFCACLVLVDNHSISCVCVRNVHHSEKEGRSRLCLFLLLFCFVLLSCQENKQTKTATLAHLLFFTFCWIFLRTGPRQEGTTQANNNMPTLYYFEGRRGDAEAIRMMFKDAKIVRYEECVCVHLSGLSTSSSCSVLFAFICH